MRNFPTHFWKRFQDHKERTAFITASSGKQPGEETYWEWTRRVQRLALGLMATGFEPGTRVGMVAPNSQAWLDFAFATWLIGGCVVPLVADRERRETLRCLARSGCDWIVTRDQRARLDLRGQASSLPDHLQWVVLEGDDEGVSGASNVHTFKSLEEAGRDRLRRGGLNALAERTYGLDAKLAALILFEPEPGPDPHAAYFSGGRLAIMLEYLSRDLALEDDSCLAVLLSYGWLSAPLFTLAALLNGHTVAMAATLSELNASLSSLRPTHLVCGPAFLEGQSSRWRQRIEAAPEFLRRLADPDAEGTFDTLSRAMGLVGERAAQKLIYEPMKSEFGGKLRSIYVWGGSVPDDVYDILDHAKIEVLGHFGFAECGVSHMEHPGARRRHSVGRPVHGYACKIAGAKAEGTGEVMIRADVLFDGYWAGAEGPREVDEHGWLKTGAVGHIHSGYLFLGDAPSST
ncbi:MAG: acyl--CoA ligase [Bradymonadaceae bacterium]|nr:acyl--CoA ligase [Lujinxingiaceae bacterium]